LLLDDSTAHAQAIVVLGAGLIGDCVPNLNAMRRVVRAAHLFKEGRAPLLIMTGGTGEGTCPVSQAMADFAHELGVPTSQIVTERESRSTWENGEKTAPLLRERHVERILLVTDRLHMRRAAGVFARHGFVVQPSAVPIYEGHPDNVSMLYAGLRETIALAYYGVRRWRAGEPTANTPAHVPAGERPIVVLGASYAANWRVGDVGGVPVVNAGVPGQQSFEMLARFDSDVISARPRAVVLWGFINDIFRADDVDRALTRVRESYEDMIERARAQGIEPILATEVTIRTPKTIMDTVKARVGSVLGKVSYQDVVNGHVMVVNQWLRDTGQRKGLLVLDLQRTLAGGDGPRRWIYAADDGSHVSEEGYRALTEYATPILTRHLGLPSESSGRP
jgi:uncharacterized SAM-binding protein YcdF (DUF218 family)/lysophospholipase L1-like esterase